MTDIVLASKSPRRIEMLNTCGYSPQVYPSSYEEVQPFPMVPKDVVMYNALSKALTVAREKEEFKDKVVVGSDTIVVLDNEIMEKPKDKEDAARMLLALAGREHEVISGVAIVNLSKPRIEVFSEVTKVEFKDYTREDIEDYLNTDEPYDKAGAYAIQGHYKKYISRVAGDVNNVIGFPLERFESVYHNFMSF